MVKLSISSFYSYKDQYKANVANKFIGIGAKGSSTESYRESYGQFANCVEYTRDDVVFISINGRRPGAVGVEEIADYVKTAASVSARFVTDNKRNRYRDYNSGERDVANLLVELNYKELENNRYSLWVPDK